MSTDPAATHVYLSTACLHGRHGYCQAPVRPDGIGKSPARCKFCASRCVCDCHLSDADLTRHREDRTQP